MNNIIDLVETYSGTSGGNWLNLFDWRKVKIKPMNLNIEGFVTAIYFSPFNTIGISTDKDERVWFGSLIHELYHAYQRDQYGLMKYIFKKTFNRSDFEEPAKQAELNATEWIGDYKIKQWQKEKEK